MGQDDCVVDRLSGSLRRPPVPVAFCFDHAGLEVGKMPKCEACQVKMALIDRLASDANRSDTRAFLWAVLALLQSAFIVFLCLRSGG